MVSTSNYILQLVMRTESEVGTELLVRTESEMESELPIKMSTHLFILFQCSCQLSIVLGGLVTPGLDSFFLCLTLFQVPAGLDDTLPTKENHMVWSWLS